MQIYSIRSLNYLRGLFEQDSQQVDVAMREMQLPIIFLLASFIILTKNHKK
jgi:hypothetical protein